MGIDLVRSWSRENWFRENWSRGSWFRENWSRGSTPAIVRRSDRNLLSENGGSILITPTGQNPFSAGWILSSKKVVRPRRWRWKISRQLRNSLFSTLELWWRWKTFLQSWSSIGTKWGSALPQDHRGQWRWRDPSELRLLEWMTKDRLLQYSVGHWLESSFQLIYQGKTSACLLRYQFRDDWHVTRTTQPLVERRQDGVHWKDHHTIQR